MKVDTLIHGIRRLYTMDPARDGLGLIEHASIATYKNNVAWIGPSKDAPEAETVIHGTGLVGLPGLIDPHTHGIWAGSRANEFSRRLAGENYADILEAGGGILSTVAATRNASIENMRSCLDARLERMRRRGVTTVETKSGYGLEVATERRMLSAMSGQFLNRHIIRTYLGGHTIPAEHRANRDAYVRQIIEEQLPVCAPLSEFVDVYCDRGAFNKDEAIAILKAGQAHGLKVRAHAEQVTHTGIAEAAAKLGATCLDHLEHIDDAGIAAMADSGTVAVLLPGAQLYLKDTAPPVDAFRAAGIPIALGTDLNPGSSPVHDIWTIATLACLIQGLTVDEAILGITRNAAKALDLPRHGWLGQGSAANIALFAPPPGEPATVESLVQHMGLADAEVVIQRGARVV